MQILINTITRAEVAEIREKQEKDGIKPKDLFTGIYDIKWRTLHPWRVETRS